MGKCLATKGWTRRQIHTGDREVSWFHGSIIDDLVDDSSGPDGARVVVAISKRSLSFAAHATLSGVIGYKVYLMCFDLADKSWVSPERQVA